VDGRRWTVAHHLFRCLALRFSTASKNNSESLGLGAEIQFKAYVQKLSKPSIVHRLPSTFLRSGFVCVFFATYWVKTFFFPKIAHTTDRCIELLKYTTHELPPF